jgi:hypothetical protein
MAQAMLIVLEVVLNTIRILVLHLVLFFNKQAEIFVFFRLHNLVYQLHELAQRQPNNIVVCAFDSFYQN